MRRLGLIAAGLVLAAACRERTDLTAVLALDGHAEAGRAQYQIHCARCHGSEGGGVAGAPALTGSGGLHDPAVVDAMINGKGGMPAQRLTPQQAADVLAWMRQTWP